MAESKFPADFDEIVKAVTYEQLVQHLDQVEAKRPCSACGNNNWFIMMDADERKPLLMQTTSARNFSHAYWYFGAACTNCGHVRMYHANFVAKCLQKSEKVDA